MDGPALRTASPRAARCRPVPNRSRGPCPSSAGPLRQCLPNIGLRNAKLPGDCGRLDACFKAARTAFSLPVVNKPALSSAAALRRCGLASATGSFPRRQSTATLGLDADRRKQRIDFYIIQPLQCSGQVRRQEMALLRGQGARSGFARWNSRRPGRLHGRQSRK